MLCTSIFGNPWKLSEQLWDSSLLFGSHWNVFGMIWKSLGGVCGGRVLPDISYIGMCPRCKENHFYSLPFRQAEASTYQPRCHFNQPRKLFDEQNNILISQFFCYSNPSKNITCPSGKLKTGFTSPIEKSASPGLSDTTFFARWCHPKGWGFCAVLV